MLVPPDQRKPTTTESAAQEAPALVSPPGLTVGKYVVVEVVALSSPACASFADTPKQIATSTPDTKKRIKTF